MLMFSLLQTKGEQCRPSRAVTPAEHTVTSRTSTVPSKNTFQRSTGKRVQVSPPSTRDAKGVLQNLTRRMRALQTDNPANPTLTCTGTQGITRRSQAVVSPIHLSVLALERTNTGCSLPLTPSPHLQSGEAAKCCCFRA